MERWLVDITNNNQTSYSKDIEFPQFLAISVEESLKETSVEEIRKVRSVLGNQLRGPVILSLDTKGNHLYYSVPVYSFIDLSEDSIITFSLSHVAKPVSLFLQIGLGFPQNRLREMAQSRALTSASTA